mgnify:CR=1 FL=1
MMEKYKGRLVYLGIPFLAALLLAIKRGHIDNYILLQRMLLIIFGYLASVTDIRSKRVPNKLVGAMAAAWILVIVPQLFFQTEKALAIMVSGLIGFVMAGLLFLVVYLISRKGLGGGDVKLMAAAGLYLGFNGVLPAMLYGSVLASVFALVLILAKKIGRKDAIPLVPFLYVGMLLTMFLQ